MSVTTAFKSALPIWLVMMAGFGAAMFIAKSAPTAADLWRYALVGIISLPAIVWFIVKKTADDLTGLRSSMVEDRKSDG